jgi:hypothetical protein
MKSAHNKSVGVIVRGITKIKTGCRSVFGRKKPQKSMPIECDELAGFPQPVSDLGYVIPALNLPPPHDLPGVRADLPQPSEPCIPVEESVEVLHKPPIAHPTEHPPSLPLSLLTTLPPIPPTITPTIPPPGLLSLTTPVRSVKL